MWVFTPFIFYTLTQLLFNAYNPLARLLVIPLLGLYFIFYQKIRSLFCISYQNRINFWKKFFLIMAILLFVARIIHFSVRMIRPIKHMEDIAHLNYDAYKTLFVEHKNPYNQKINSYSVIKSNGLSFDYFGYKYPPLQFVYYAPFIKWLGKRGIFLGNFIVYIGLTILIFIMLINYSIVHASLGVLAFLSTDFIFTLSFNKGTNDLLPTFLAFFSLYFLKKKKRNSSGLLLGISLLVKQLPGSLIFLLFLLQKNYRAIFMAIIIFIIGISPFVIWDWHSFYLQVVEFVLVRPVRATSFLRFFPSLVANILTLSSLIIIVLLSIMGRWKTKWNIIENNALIPISIFIFLLFSKMTPTHYFVWVVPFLIIWYFSLSLRD